MLTQMKEAQASGGAKSSTSAVGLNDTAMHKVSTSHPAPGGGETSCAKVDDFDGADPKTMIAQAEAGWSTDAP